jgi:asparagine synthase (glutamine-hydrolysing)
MSGIAGILHFDGRPVSRPDLDRAANALRLFGPDRSGSIAAGSVGFINVLMRMTPQDQFDRQPWRGESGALITADIRLDNRDDMLARASIPSADATAWPDSRVLLACWEKLGDEIWPLLRGPFAAAIWDPRSRVLTLARDQLGLNVVMWHRREHLFAFATMPNGLFALGAPRELSEEKFADFMVLNHVQHETTIYRHIYRVPPAHVIRVTDNGTLEQRCYWSPADIRPIRLVSDAAYAEGLRDCLERAVRRQMRSIHPLGSLLSGGLDSSSVSALAARTLAEKGERLSAFTGVPRAGFNGSVPAGCYADETPYVEAIKHQAGNIDVTYVHNDACDDLAELERFFITLEAPVRNPSNFGWPLAILRLARRQGRRVLLGGLHGNITISWDGWSQSVTHLLTGRLLTAYRQWLQYYRRTPYSRWVALRKLFIEPLVPDALGAWASRRRRSRHAWQAHAAIRPDTADKLGVDVRARTAGHDFLYRMRPDERAKALSQVDYAGDWQAAEKAATGVEVRDPTADIDVVSYCFGVPPQQYLMEGIDRSLIRRAMWGLLPELVLRNRLNGLQAADWHEKLQSQRDALARQIAELKESPRARRIVDVARLERALGDWPTGGWHTAAVFQEYNLALTRGVAGGRFLRWFESAN